LNDTLGSCNVLRTVASWPTVGRSTPTGAIGSNGKGAPNTTGVTSGETGVTDAIQVTPAAAAPIAAMAATPVARVFTVTKVLSVKPTKQDVNAVASVPHFEFPHETEIAGSVDASTAPPCWGGKGEHHG
jgi:hypothetical protein